MSERSALSVVPIVLLMGAGCAATPTPIPPATIEVEAPDLAPACSDDSACGDGQSCVFGQCAPCGNFEPIDMVPAGVASAGGPSPMEKLSACLDAGGLTLRVEIDCSSDGRGSETEQIALAHDRAIWIQNELVTAGVDASRIALAPTDRWLPAPDSRCRFRWLAP